MAYELSPSQILFVVMCGAKVGWKAQLAHSTWCNATSARCVFAADTPFPDASGEPFPAMFAPTPSREPTVSACCSSMRRETSSKSFFCQEHRKDTLLAQYRFLPALETAKAEYIRNETKWVALVDDDSFVSVPNLVRHLSTLNPELPLYLGDTHPTRDFFACGGGGSIFSIAAMHQMNLTQCARASAEAAHCLQSDWMLGECALRSRVSFLRNLSCWTCVPGHNNRAGVERPSYEFFSRSRCAFAQKLLGISKLRPTLDMPPLVKTLSMGVAIVHGIPTDWLRLAYEDAMGWWRNGSVLQPPPPPEPLDLSELGAPPRLPVAGADAPANERPSPFTEPPAPPEPDEDDAPWRSMPARPGVPVPAPARLSRAEQRKAAKAAKAASTPRVGAPRTSPSKRVHVATRSNSGGGGGGGSGGGSGRHRPRRLVGG